MSDMGVVVSVIVPAFNAAPFLDETLQSVRAQTFRDIEIIVVDDGSTDRTHEIAMAHAAADPRLRVIRQDNGGVARARNAGLAAAVGRWVAPCDADDLWAPQKLERQIARWEAAGSEVSLVYCWSAAIDRAGLIRTYDNHHHEEGAVFDRLCRGNFVGNGSCALMDRHAALALGGYDPSLRDRGGEGCEDLKLYLGLARSGRFAVVPEYLVGYRQTADNMSAQIFSMLRSYDLMVEALSVAVPEAAEALAEGRRNLMVWLRMRALIHRRFVSMTRMHLALMAQAPGFAIKTLWWSELRPALRRVLPFVTAPVNPLVPDRPTPFLGAEGSGAEWALSV